MTAGGPRDDEPAGLTDDARRNRRAWNAEAARYVANGRRNWAATEESWGIWDIPEAELRVLPDVAGLDVVELGCGTAYWSAWLARRGARPVGVDLSEAQLATARALQAEHDLRFALLHASATRVPCRDAAFDLAFSEYGASIWCEPEAWLAEAHRLLRPGGRLVFLCNGVLAMLCSPPSGEAATERLERDLFGLRRTEWPGEEGVDFHLPHGEMIRLLGEIGFVVEALHELRAPPGPDEQRFFVPRAWARRWPCEEIWVARRR